MKLSVLQFFVLIMVLVSTGCKKESQVPEIDFMYEYYPEKVGQWIIYDVDSTIYNKYFDTIYTITLQVKEVIESKFLDNEGRVTNRIERYERDTIGDPWVIKDVWASTRTATTLEVVEENLRFIKLIFPPVEGVTWLGNSYISAVDELSWYKDWEYEYIEVDEPRIFGGKVFTNTATVLQNDDNSNLLRLIYFTESYGKNVGMIYRENLYLTRSNITPGSPWTDGYILKMTVNSYGDAN